MSLLESTGAEIVPFRPLHDDCLPRGLDGLYLGGGYPELHAEGLQSNETMRKDILSFARAGGLIYAECGGMMYLTGCLYTGGKENHKQSQMCGVFPDRISRMTPHMKMHYAVIEFTSNNPIFTPGQQCRGQKFHFSETLLSTEESNSDDNSHERRFPIKVTPETVKDVQSELVGLVYKNVVASYYHLHFASNTSIASEFTQKALECSPSRHHTAISFVSSATEIIFAIGAESKLGGVTSLCDYPPEARCAPRRIVCRSKIDASKMTSEEVDEAMKVMKERSESRDGDDTLGPGLWLTDDASIKTISPKVVFVQSSCDICDPRQDDVVMALRRTSLTDVEVVTVSPTTLEGVFASIHNVAKALDLPQKGASLCYELRQRLHAVQIALSKQEENTLKPSVLSLEGLSPLCTGGNWLPDIKTAAGCRDAFGEKGGADARVVTWDEVVSADPDVLILSPCSASLDRTLSELHHISSETSFWKLRCVQNGDVYIIDHNRFSRPGPRLVSGIEMLATLLRGIPPPTGAQNEWVNEVLKYNGNLSSTDIDNTSMFAADLAGSFKSPFAPSVSQRDDQNPLVRTKTGLKSFDITCSSIPDFPHPESRSAHCMIHLPYVRDSIRSSFLIFSGENQDGKRLKDAWKLSFPVKGFEATVGHPSHCNDPRLGWEYLGNSIGSVADEDVPSIRSNSAATVCGSDHLLVFGGWGRDNLTPLSSCELLHLETLCWTHCSTRGSCKPPPRGNPTLVYSPCHNRAILFGGWNRIHRLNDLWSLDLGDWKWTQSTKPVLKESKAIWPRNRTDHSAVLWQQNEKSETMIVYGGSVEGCDSGTSGELWFLDCSHKNSQEWIWDKIVIDGPNPPCRSSHSAAIVGKGKSASMIILGGTDVSTRGSGKAAIVGDAWLLVYLGLTDRRSWIKLPWDGLGIQRCRHTMTVIGSSVFVWGGWDGEGTVEDTLTLWHGSLDDHFLGQDEISKANNRKSESGNNGLSNNKKNSHAFLQERWEAETPFRKAELPPYVLKQTINSRIPNALIRAMHKYAVLQGKDTYIDPLSGYSVFTQLYLKKRACCGNGCRHCPYGHINVPKKKKHNSRGSFLEETDTESVNSSISSCSNSSSLSALVLDW